MKFRKKYQNFMIGKTLSFGEEKRCYREGDKIIEPWRAGQLKQCPVRRQIEMVPESISIQSSPPEEPGPSYPIAKSGESSNAGKGGRRD